MSSGFLRVSSPWMARKVKDLSSWNLDCNCSRWVATHFFFHPYLGKSSNLTNIFQMGWNHQPVLMLQRIRPWKAPGMYKVSREVMGKPSWRLRHFWVDDVPFPKVGYVSSLKGIVHIKWCAGFLNHQENVDMPFFGSVCECPKNPGFPRTNPLLIITSQGNHFPNLSSHFLVKLA